MTGPPPPVPAYTVVVMMELVLMDVVEEVDVVLVIMTAVVVDEGLVGGVIGLSDVVVEFIGDWVDELVVGWNTMSQKSP